MNTKIIVNITPAVAFFLISTYDFTKFIAFSGGGVRNGSHAVFLFAAITELKEGLHLSKDTHKLPSQVKMFDNHLATLSIVTLETRPHLSTITLQFGTFQKPHQVEVIKVYYDPIFWGVCVLT